MAIKIEKKKVFSFIHFLRVDSPVRALALNVSLNKSWGWFRSAYAQRLGNAFDLFKKKKKKIQLMNVFIIHWHNDLKQQIQGNKNTQ